MGYKVCQVHGAGSPKQGRPGGRPITTGRQSRHLPTRLAARYYEALGDADLLVLRDEIALIDARLSDVLVRVDSGEAGKVWQQIKSTYDELAQAIRAQDNETMARCINDLGKLAGRGAADWAAWDEVKNLVMLRSQLIRTESDRLMKMQQYITVEKLNALIAVLFDLISKNVTDRRQVVKIAHGLKVLLEHGSG